VVRVFETADRFETVIPRPIGFHQRSFSSGTTGDPKAIPWTQPTPINAPPSAFHQNVQLGDVIVWPTTWLDDGPWLIFREFIRIGPTIGLYHGTPTGREFGRFRRECRRPPSRVWRVWSEPGAIAALQAGHDGARSKYGFSFNRLECSMPIYAGWMALAGGNPPPGHRILRRHGHPAVDTSRELSHSPVCPARSNPRPPSSRCR